MSFALLQKALLMPAEIAVNQALGLDSASRRRLKRLDGKVLQVTCASPPVTLTLAIEGEALRLLGLYEGEADVSLRGPLPALMSLLLQQQGRPDFRKLGIEVRGDVEVAAALQKLARDLRIDWEFLLSRVVGDIPTQAFSDALHTSRDTLRQGRESLFDDLEEYLHEESRWLPARDEVEDFYRRIGELRLNVDRLEARLQRLREKVSTRESRTLSSPRW